MKRFTFLTVPASLLAIASIGISEDEPGIKSNTLPKARQGLTTSTTGEGRTANQAANQAANDQRMRAEKPSPDEEAINKTGDSYAAAFSAGDAKATAAHFTTDAEYVDSQGIIYQGRQAIEDVTAAFFANNPGSKLELKIDALRFVSPGVAIEDGVTIVTPAKDSTPIVYQYTAVHVKNAGKWLTASVREQSVKNMRAHRSQLQQLEWMIGEWVHEGDDAVVRFSCHPTDNGNFLVRKFTVHVAGQETMTGTQRIGWDAQAGKFRAWVFDSAGGFSEGFWHRDGDDWVLKLIGVTPDGESASTTSVYTFVDERTMTFRSVNHEIGGVELQDSDPLTIVRRAPVSQSEADVLQ